MTTAMTARPRSPSRAGYRAAEPGAATAAVGRARASATVVVIPRTPRCSFPGRESVSAVPAAPRSSSGPPDTVRSPGNLPERVNEWPLSAVSWGWRFIGGRRSRRTVPMIEAEAMRAARILVIDDDETNLRLMRRMLERAGYEHVT